MATPIPQSISATPQATPLAFASVAEYATFWFAAHVVHLGPNTQAAYRIELDTKILPILGEIDLLAVTPRMLRDWMLVLRGRKLAGATIRRAFAVLSSMLNHAVEHEHLGSNPAVGIRRPARRRTRPLVVYSDDQVRRFLDVAYHVTPTLAPMFVVMARAGLRVGEGRALHGEDCDLGAQQLTVRWTAHKDGKLGPPKDREIRTVAMSPAVATALTPLLPRRGLLFEGRTGRAFSYTRVRDVMLEICERATLPLTSPHSLRHSFTAILLNRGASPAWVQQQLGHGSLDLTVKTYGQWLPHPRPGALDEL